VCGVGVAPRRHVPFPAAQCAFRCPERSSAQELRELVLRLRALDRRRTHNRPPVREIAGLRLDPFRREVYRDGRYVALTRKQFAVLEVLVAAEGGVISAEELLERAWDENAGPFTNAVRITVSALRKRLGEPRIIATVGSAGSAAGWRCPARRRRSGGLLWSPARRRQPARVDPHYRAGGLIVEVFGRDPISVCPRGVL
jgi:Transcriptional regulatory protein, C terminal